MDGLEQLADERDRLREQERETLSRLVETRAKISKLRNELQSLRKTRDELNDTVKALKKNRDELHSSSKQNLAKLREIIKITRGSDEGSRAEREMVELEWKIQTSTLDKDQEKALLNKVRVLESKVGAHRKTLKLSENIGKNRREADEIHTKIQELASQSQAYHLEVVNLGDKFQELRQKLEEQSKGLAEIRLRATEVGQKYDSLVKERIQSERISQKQKERAYKENLIESAKKKLSQRGKVSLEELGALMGDEEE